jgi:starch phosphorylase
MILDENDAFFHLADLSAYLDAQERAARVFNDPAEWARMAVLNVARIGKFSSDRAVSEYARQIWRIEGV